jgi:hypothetical protein
MCPISVNDEAVDQKGDNCFGVAVSSWLCDSMRDPTTHEKHSAGAIALKPLDFLGAFIAILTLRCQRAYRTASAQGRAEALKSLPQI